MPRRGLQLKLIPTKVSCFTVHNWLSWRVSIWFHLSRDKGQKTFKLAQFITDTCATISLQSRWWLLSTLSAHRSIAGVARLFCPIVLFVLWHSFVLVIIALTRRKICIGMYQTTSAYTRTFSSIVSAKKIVSVYPENRSSPRFIHQANKFELRYIGPKLFGLKISHIASMQ
jgi:hypothetical protein